MTQTISIICPKCSSPNMTKMPYPLEDKGYRCMICGKDVWIQLVDMSMIARRKNSLR